MFFESADARCAANQRKFLWFRWNGPHQQTEVTSVARWGPRRWAKWEVNWTCKACGSNLHRFGIDEALMIRAGLGERMRAVR